MIYVLANIFGLVFSVLALACEATRGNITHLKNGRKPNAGAAVFPTIFVIPLFFNGLAWGIKNFFSVHDLTIFLGIAFVLLAAISIAFLKLNAEFRTLKKTR